MRTTSTGLTIVLAVVIGVVATWLWTSQRVAPAAGTSPELQKPAPQAPLSSLEAHGNSRPQSDMHSGESSARPESTPATASVPPPPGDEIAAARDDSTYFKMLALMHSRRDTANVAGAFTRMHETFVLTPDDPSWGRRTEQALRDFFRKHPADGLEITSISCRSAGCEVQALAESPGDPGVPAAEEPAPREPPVALRDDLPVGLSLKRQAVFVLPLGDRSGYLVTYTRVEPRQEATSP